MKLIEYIYTQYSFYKWSRSSEFTAKKVKTDSERDRILKGITDLLYAYILHAVLFCALIFLFYAYQSEEVIKTAKQEFHEGAIPGW